MVSPKLSTITALALVFFIFTNESVGASYHPSEDTSFASQKVNLSVYYASLCQPCATFIVKNLEGIFHGDLINIVNLQLVPWANAYVDKTNHSIICQNGPDECELNSLEACALNVLNDVNKHYALIYCFEFLAIEGRHKNWQDCFTELELPKEPILNCYNTGNGTEIGQKYINEAAPLYTPYEVLPWVVVNNQSIGKEYENFTRYVCEAYRGTPVPAACNPR
uniref:Gamma-interferon-inducible lysosomal thiol reductase n=2 Tax=Cajanus cajan TaxID=3821 RepID=A0A151QXI7_CAJCA|nr:Gamma-interferon-inducible lysosomal thiol reductase [Cajanus cajan]